MSKFQRVFARWLLSSYCATPVTAWCGVIVSSTLRQSLQTDRSQINAGGNVTVYGAQSVKLSATDVDAGGKALVQSKGDIELGYNTDTEQHNWTTSSTDRSWWGKKTTTTTQHETADKTAEVTKINASEVQVLGNNITSLGADINGQNLVQVEGVGKTALYAVNEEHLTKADSQSTSSWIGITYSNSKSSDSSLNTTALGTTITSQEAIKVGVGTVTDVRGAIMTAPKIDIVRSAGADTSKPGELILGTSTNTTETNHTESTTTAGVWAANSGNGSTTETANNTVINGKLNIGAGINTTVQIPEGNLKDQIASLSQQPGMGYLNDLASNPNIKWEQVKLAHDEWSYSQQGLTPAGAALLSIAIAVYTGGMGAELLGGTAGTAATATTAATQATLMGSTAFGAAANAGFAALAASAGVSFVNNGGDIGKTLKDMGSSQNVKNVLTAMATAGVLNALGSTPTATGQTGVNAQVISTAQAVDKFAANLMQNVTNNMASAVVSSAINGKPLSEETLTTALSTAFITAGMAQTANSIGAATTGDNPALNAYTQAMAHALAGCVGGAATTANSGGCSAGAVGAVVGELSAKFAMENGMDGAGALKLATTMSAAAGALVGGPDSAAAVNVASQMGTNAAANNYLSHVKPSLMELSEVEKYNRAVAECGPANPAACALRDEMASLSMQRDRALALACNGQTPDLCGSLARQAVAMGNLVRGSNGEFVYANSSQAGPIQGLNTATIGPVSRPDNFHDKVSASTAQGLAFIGGGLGADSALTAAVNGGMKTFEAYKTAQQAYNLGTSAATGAATAVITYTASEVVKSIPVAVNNQSASDGVNNFFTNWNAQEATNSAFWGAIGGVGTTQMFKWSGVANESIFKQLANPSASVIVIRANSSAISQAGKAATTAIVDQPSKK